MRWSSYEDQPDASDGSDDIERAPSVVGATPLKLFLREHADVWLTPAAGRAIDAMNIGDTAQRLLDCLRTRGASFEHELSAAVSLRTEETRAALAELVAAGLVTSDGFAGLRSLIAPATTGPRPVRIEAAGRWSALAPDPDGRAGDRSGSPSAQTVEAIAWTLLRRYGVVFRRLLAREQDIPWRDLARVYRLLEARGDIRGGRFVSGMSGEQFALPEAVEKLREIRRSGDDHRLITISAADPLNFAGILTPGDRIRTVASNRIVYRNGVPVAAMEGDMLRSLSEVEPDVAAEAAAAAAGRRVPVVRGFVGRLG